MQTRQEHVLTAIRLEYFTVGYNILEGIVALLLGGIANSVALIGFGLDSFVETGHKLLTAERPDPSAPGIVLAALSLVIMPVLAYRKRHAGRRLASAALVSDSKQTVACAFLSVFLLAGLVLNAAFGWWWADPIGALAMLPWLIQEGREALSGRACCD